ncbi:hypothetical protein Tco_0088112 [Tanacetum coccineum]
MNLPPIEPNFRCLVNHDPDPRSHTGAIRVPCDYGHDDKKPRVDRSLTGYLTLFSIIFMKVFQIDGFGLQGEVDVDFKEERMLDRLLAERNSDNHIGRSCPFWRQIEPLFSFPSYTDICYLKRLLSGLIPEEGDNNENDDTESNGYGSTFEDETDIKSNGFMEFSGVGPFYGYGKTSARRFHKEPVCSVSDYQTMSKDNRLLMEIQSIGLCPQLMVGALFSNTLVGSGHGSKQPNVVQKVDDDIYGLISDLGNKYHEQTSVLDKHLKTTTEAKALQEK